MSAHDEVMATLKGWERQQIERYRPKLQPVASESRRPADVSVPALNMVPASPVAQADMRAAHQMVATINQMQAEGSISTPMFGGSDDAA